MKKLTKEQRLEAIEKINKSFLSELRDANIELSDNAICRVYDDSIQLGISKADGSGFEFGSGLDLHPKSNLGFRPKENSINFGSSGSFSPDNEAVYWRTIHSASILKNWHIVSDIVNEHCKQFGTIY